MHKIQSGERVLEPEAKIIQEDSFMAKVDKVVAALSVSHSPTLRQYKYFQTGMGRILTAGLGKQAPLPQCDDHRQLGVSHCRRSFGRAPPKDSQHKQQHTEEQGSRGRVPEEGNGQEGKGQEGRRG